MHLLSYSTNIQNGNCCKRNDKGLLLDTGEGNGNPLQCSCLENPRDGGAWWAAVCGAAQSQTRMKWLSSSSMQFRVYGPPSQSLFCQDSQLHPLSFHFIHLIKFKLRSTQFNFLHPPADGQILLGEKHIAHNHADCSCNKLMVSNLNRRTDAEAVTPILWPPHVKNWLFGKDPDTGKDWRQEKGMTEDEMAGWYHQLSGHEFEQALGVSDGQGSLVCCSPGVSKSQTQRRGWTDWE